MADDSGELLEEDGRALQKHIGCLAGLLQIFDRQRCLTGRRFGSSRTRTTTEVAVCNVDVAVREPGGGVVDHESGSGGEGRRGSAAGEAAATRVSFERFCRSPDSARIRSAVASSLLRESPRVESSHREVMAGLIRLKNLARSRSVGGRSVEFPRWSSEAAPNLQRLTVELEDGPVVGTRRLQRVRSERDAVMDLDRALGVVDLKESFRALQRERRPVPKLCVDARRSPPRAGSNVVARLMGLEDLSSPPASTQPRRGRSLPPNHRFTDSMPPQRAAPTSKLTKHSHDERPSPTNNPLRGHTTRKLRSRSAPGGREALEALQLKGLRRTRNAIPEYVKQRPVAMEHASPGRGSPVRSAKAPPTPHVGAHPLAGASTKLSSSPKQGQSHLRDRRESRAAMVTFRVHQPQEFPSKDDAIPNASPDNAITSWETQSGKSSPEMRRQRRPSRTTSNQSPAPRASSPGRDYDDGTATAAATRKKPSSENASAGTQTSTTQDSCLALQTPNAIPARIREILQTLKDGQVPLTSLIDGKEIGEVMTPRAGFLVEKFSPALEKCGLGSEGCEQCSPVSVLDNNLFEEDGSPSSLPGANLQDPCEEDREENGSGDKRREFVDELLTLSDVSWASGTLSSRIKLSELNPTVLKEELQRASDVFFHNREKGEKVSMLDRRALIDFVYELLGEYESTQPWIGGQRLKRHSLVHKIWREIQELPCASSVDICGTVQSMLAEDLGSRGPTWTDFPTEVGEVGMEVEKLIYRDLLEEVVKDLKSSRASGCSEETNGPRRQLFAV